MPARPTIAQSDASRANGALSDGPEDSGDTIPNSPLRGRHGRGQLPV